MHIIQRLLRRIVDFALPLQCVNCRRIVSQEHALCATCWPLFNFVNVPLCDRCGRPFELEVDPGTLCLLCLKKDVPWQQQRFAFTYTQESKGLILQFKHHDGTHLAKAFGYWMSRSYLTFTLPHDFIIPVPLHWTRLFMRRYNQAGLLAQNLSSHINVPILINALHRTRRTPSQGKLTSHARSVNVKKAFTLHPGNCKQLQGKSVLLVDDVFTTGSTVKNCAESLLEAGVKRVDVLTLSCVLTKEPSS